MRVALITTTNPKGVGWRLRKWVYHPAYFLRPHENSIIRVFINPKIVKQSDQITDGPLRLSEASVPGRDNKLKVPFYSKYLGKTGPKLSHSPIRMKQALSI